MRARNSRIPGTLEYFQRSTWQSIRYRCKNINTGYKAKHYAKKQIDCLFSKEEFYAWARDNWHIAEQIRATGETPSIDRIDTDGPYGPENVRLIAFAENSRLGRAVITKKYGHKCRIFMKDGRILEFDSLAQAGRGLGIAAKGLKHLASGRYKTNKNGVERVILLSAPPWPRAKTKKHTGPEEK